MIKCIQYNLVIMIGNWYGFIKLHLSNKYNHSLCKIIKAIYQIRFCNLKLLPEISLILISLARGNCFCKDKCKMFSPPLRVATLGSGTSVYFLKANYEIYIIIIVLK